MRKVVSITADGQNRIVTTDAATVGDVLQRAGVTLDQGDLVEPGLQTVLPSGFFNVNVYRSQLYDVVDGVHSSITRSAQRSPRLIAAGAGITVYPEDQASVEMVNNFVSDRVVGQRLIINRATPVNIKADGATKLYRSQATTVGALLKEKGLSLGAKDVVTPDQTQSLIPGLQISITRVADAIVTKTETLPHSVKTIPDPNQPKGTSNVKTSGSDGSRQVTYHIHYQNGAEIARETLKVEGQVNPVDQVMIVGTKVAFAGSIEYWRPLVTEAATANGLDPNKMLSIMSCESGGDASNYNGRRFGLSVQQALKNDNAMGLFQFKPSTWYGLGGTVDNIFDGPTQIRLAAYKMSHYGFSAWACQ